MNKRKKPKVLLVEYNQTIAELTKDAMEKAGFRVYLASNGKDAIEMYFEKIRRPDLIITNVPMPYMNGLEVVKSIRKHNKRIPILFLSDLNSTEDVVRGYEVGGNDYIRKPIEMGELILRIRALLDRHSTNFLTSASEQPHMQSHDWQLPE